MPRSSPIDYFSLAYERGGSGPGVVLLHGWPGDHGDYRRVRPLLSGHAGVVVPDGIGHFVPLEAPDAVASAIGTALPV